MTKKLATILLSRPALMVGSTMLLLRQPPIIGQAALFATTLLWACAARLPAAGDERAVLNG